MKLHLGCGTRSLKPWGFTDVDIRRDLDNPDPRCLCDPNVIDDIFKLEKFADESVELLYYSHGLEHAKRHERFDVLKQWKRVLMIGGVLRLSVPDFDVVARAHVEKTVPFEKLWSSLNGSQRHFPHDVHYHVYTFDSLKADLESVGFANVRRYDAIKTEYAEVMDFSQAFYPLFDKSGINLSLNVECDKV